MQIGQYIEYAGTAAERVAAQTLADMAERLGRGFGARWIETDTGNVYLYTPAGWLADPSIIQAENGTLSVSENQPTITRLSGTKAASGDNEIVAAPAAGNRLIISFLASQLEVDAPTTMIWKSGTSAAYRFYAPSIGAGFIKDFPAGREWQLPEAMALNLNLSGANSCGYSVEYRTEAI